MTTRHIVQSLLETMMSSSSFEEEFSEQRQANELLHQLVQKLRGRTLVTMEEEDSSSISSSTDDDGDDSAVKNNDSSVEEEFKKNKSTPTTSVRTVLGNLPASQVSQLSDLLATWIATSRVDVQQLLPLTYDAEANEQAMQSSTTALTLTRTALVAAEVYAQLLSLPGALGTGLVQLQALSALSALMRRWRMECCGREEDDKTTLMGKNHARKDIDDDDVDEKAQQPLKRSRLNSSSESESSDDEDDDNYGANLVVEEEIGGETLSPHQLITMGLRVGRELCMVPLQKEFMSWSSEAREAVIESVTSVLATAPALMANNTSSKQRMAKDVSSVATLGHSVVKRASNALDRCIIEPMGTDNNDGSESLTKRHETAVAILRGLFPIITMKDQLPKGESGKQAAAATASQVLECFVEGISGDIAVNPGSWPRSMTASPATTATPTTPVKTPGKHSTPQRGRYSVTPNSKLKSRSMTPTPAKLKTKNTPWSVSTSGLTPLASSGARPRPVFSAILGVFQKLVTIKGLEKASSRTGIVETVHRCIRHLPTLERSIFLRFLIQLCHSKISIHRLLGSELAGLILSEDWIWNEHAGPISADPTTPASRRKSLSPLVTKSSENMPAALFETLQGRLFDVVPATRVASANALAGIFSRLSAASVSSLSESSGLVQTVSIEADILAESLRTRSRTDEKATVRRAAVGALVELLNVCQTSDEISYSVCEEDVIVMSELCRDASMLTRKASAEGLSRLLECCLSHENYVLSSLERAWSASVLPLALDSANSCVSKAVDLFDRIVLNHIMDPEADTRSCQTAWRILAAVGNSSGRQGFSRSEMEALRTVLDKKMAAQATSNEFLKPLLKMIHRTAETTLNATMDDMFESTIEAQRAGVWCLFAATLRACQNPNEFGRVAKRSKIDLSFIEASWEEMLDVFISSKQGVNATAGLRGSMKQCLQVISHLASCVDPVTAKKSSGNLERLLIEFSLPNEMIGSAIVALTATKVSSSDYGGDDSDEDRKAACAASIRCIFNACKDEIASHVGTSLGDDAEARLVRALFTVGELCLVGFSATDDDSTGSGVLTKDKSGSLQSNCIQGLYERPSSQLVDLVQAFLSKHLPGSENASTPDVVRATALVSLGKLCLRDEKLAKKSLNLFARELHENMTEGSSTVQSNALLVLGDLCVKYTNMVDRFLPVMASCMQSGVTDITTTNALAAPVSNGFALVRKHAVLLLSSLLLQDYIKWRGLLFHRFLVASADEDDEVANLAVMVLCGPLVTKQPKLFSQHIVESLFVLNRCTAHPIYKTAAAMGDGGSGISVGFEGINLTGEVGRLRRLQMYELMLCKMTDEEKIGVTARIAKDVLGSALEEGSDLNRVCSFPAEAMSPDNDRHSMCESAYSVLSDAFVLLSSKALRVGRTGRGGEDETEDSSIPNTSRRALVARGKLLSNISRKHLIEIVLPILLNLKMVLQKSCSSLLKDLMRYLVVVYRLYKTELKEFLSDDPSLLQEIEYDARQFRKEYGNNDTPLSEKSFSSTLSNDE